MRRLAQGHLDAQLEGAGDRTSNLPVTSQPALAPEPYAVTTTTSPPLPPPPSLTSSLVPEDSRHNHHLHATQNVAELGPRGGKASATGGRTGE